MQLFVFGALYCPPMNARAKLRSRWFRFSLRSVSIAVAIFGIFLGLLVPQLTWIRNRNDALRTPGVSFSVGPWNPPWSIGILGAKGYRTIEIVAEQSEIVLPNGVYALQPYVGDAQISKRDKLRKLFPEATVQFVK